MTQPSAPERLESLRARRSVSPRRLVEPGPSESELAAALSAGLRAPDHGGLVPWRVVLVPPHRRDALARLFVTEKLRRDPLASPADLARASAHATSVPTLMAFVVTPRAEVTVPLHEQWLAAGAALMNVLNAFDALGFGAIVLSGDRCADPVLAAALGVRSPDVLAGFVSVGSVGEAPGVAKPKPVDAVLSVWQGSAGLPERAAERSDAADPAVG